MCKFKICGYDWTSVQDGEYTLYFMYGAMRIMSFGENNNYAESNVAECLDKSQLLKDLREKFGDKLVPFDLSLTSMDGFKDYGIKNHCLLSIPNIEILMKYGEDIPRIDNTYWLATPNQTPRRDDSYWVRCVGSDGCVFYDDCRWGRGVRPFFMTRERVVGNVFDNPELLN